MSGIRQGTNFANRPIADIRCVSLRATSQKWDAVCTAASLTAVLRHVTSFVKSGLSPCLCCGIRPSDGSWIFLMCALQPEPETLLVF